MFPVYTGPFRDLQSTFLRELTDRRRLDPVAPLTVVVSGHLQRLALRRELATAGPWLNVNFATLNELAHAAAAPHLRASGLRLLPAALRDPLLLYAIDGLQSSLDYFAQISARPGFRRAVWRTLDEFRHAGLTAAEFARLLPSLRGLGDTLRRKLTDLARIWTAVDNLRSRFGLADRISVLTIAAHTAATPSAPLLVYGLDHLTELERAFVARAAADSVLAVYVPYCPSDDYVWTLALVRWWTSQGGRPHALPLDAASPAALSQLQSSFVTRSGVEPSAPDASLHIVSAPSRDREVEQLVRRVLGDADESRTVAIISRQSGAYSDLLREELARAGVQGYLHQCRTLGHTAVGRALRLFARLLDGRLRRVDVSALLLVIRPPATGEPAEWNHLALSAGIIEGLAQWHDRLARLQRRVDRDLTRAVDDADPRVPRWRARAAALVSLREFITDLHARVERIRAAATWTELVREFQSVARALLGDGELWSETAAELESATVLDELRVPLSLDTFRALLDTALTRPVEREGRFQQHQPAVLPLEQSIGLLFDDVHLPGLVEREWPRACPADPLLSDPERRTLNRLHPPLALATRDDHDLRERFLFAAVVGAAQRRLTLSWPRSEPSTGRERLASSFVLKAATVYCGAVTDYAALDAFMRTSSAATRVPIQRLDERDSLPCASQFQWDLGAIAAGLRSRSVLPLAGLASRSPAFTRALAQERDCHVQRHFTHHDGVIAEPPLLAAVRSVHRSFSVSALETYAVCPFRYFATQLLGLAELETADSPLELPARDRGILIHEILERFYRPRLGTPDYRIDSAEWPRLAAIADAAFQAHERDHLTLTPYAWSIERDRLLRALRGWFDAECADASSVAFRPVELEAGFGARPGSGERGGEPWHLAVGGADSISLHGRIDRIDELGDGTLRVIDYKTGARKPALKHGQLDGGRALQLPVYLLAAADRRGQPASVASYVYLEATAREPISFTAADAQARDAELRATLLTLVRSLERGHFFPWPHADTCRTCSARDVCGQSRLTAKVEFDLPQTADFRALRGPSSDEVSADE